MGKVLKALGGVFLLIVVLVAGVFIYGLIVKLGSESKAYVDNAVPILVNGWNPSELKSRASEELLPFLKEPDLGNLYIMFNRLGRMTRYNGSEGQYHTNLKLPKGIVTTASYIATADFENGPGTIKMSLIRKNGTWKILEFRVNSPIFLRQ